MANKVKCENCKNIKEWSFDQNVVAFCGVKQAYVKKDDSCDKGKEKK